MTFPTAKYSIDDVVIINHKQKSDVDRIKQKILDDRETVERMKSKIIELEIKNKKKLEFVIKQFPNWSEKECIAVHKQENWTESEIELLKSILENKQ